MGKIAALADIHSNFQAVWACVEDAKSWGAERFVLLGDFVSDLSDTRLTMDLVYALADAYPCYFVRGNREGYMLEHDEGKLAFREGSRSGSLLYTFRALRREDLDFLRALPIYRQIELWGTGLEIAHASPDSDRELFQADDSKIDGVFDRMRTKYLLTGHSHKQYVREKGGKTIISPGSVGVPQGPGGMTQYARLEVDDGIRWELMQIPYDLEQTIHRQFQSGLVGLGRYWAASVLYDLITGENWTFSLLERVFEAGDVHDESLWRRAARELGIPTEEEELISRLRKER